MYVCVCVCVVVVCVCWGVGGAGLQNGPSGTFGELAAALCLRLSSRGHGSVGGFSAMR